MNSLMNRCAVPRDNHDFRFDLESPVDSPHSLDFRRQENFFLSVSESALAAEIKPEGEDGTVVD